MAPAMKLTGDVHHAEDLVQDTLVKAITKQHQFQPGTNLKAWLYIIMRNHWLVFVRRKQRVMYMDPLIDSGEWSQPAPESQDHHIELQQVMSHIGAMTPEHQQALVAQSTGHTYDEMAEAFQVPVGTIKSRVHRARKELEKSLG